MTEATENNIPNAHRERVDVLVKLIQKTDRLYDHVICSVHVKFHLRSRVAVSEAKLGFAFRHLTQPFHQSWKVKTDSSKTKHVTASVSIYLMMISADHNVTLLHSTIGYWHHTVVSPSVSDAMHHGSQGRCRGLKVVRVVSYNTIVFLG